MMILKDYDIVFGLSTDCVFEFDVDNQGENFQNICMFVRINIFINVY